MLDWLRVIHRSQSIEQATCQFTQQPAKANDFAYDSAFAGYWIEHDWLNGLFALLAGFSVRSALNNENYNLKGS